jgi:hypothetical protein
MAAPAFMAIGAAGQRNSTRPQTNKPTADRISGRPRSWSRPLRGSPSTSVAGRRGRRSMFRFIEPLPSIGRALACSAPREPPRRPAYRQAAPTSTQVATAVPLLFAPCDPRCRRRWSNPNFSRVHSIPRRLNRLPFPRRCRGLCGRERQHGVASCDRPPPTASDGPALRPRRHPAPVPSTPASTAAPQAVVGLQRPVEPAPNALSEPRCSAATSSQAASGWVSG